jgi:PAS domain S-box-containing protein
MAAYIPDSQATAFLKGGGEMASLISGYDWSQTPLGAIGSWPGSLRAVLSLILNSKFPMLIFWGPSLITFYNDAFRLSLGDNGKHPGSLGQRGEESWAESWHLIGPLIYAIMAGGEAVSFEDQKLPIYRDGRMDYAYWTYSFSAINGGEGPVEGLLVACAETTRAVESMASLQASNESLERTLAENQFLQAAQLAAHVQIEENQRRLLALFEQSPVALATIMRERLTFTSANTFYAELVGRRPEEIINRPLLVALPELAGQGFDDLLNGVLNTGQPFTADEVPVVLVRGGVLETIYVNLAYQPMRSDDGRIDNILVVATDISMQVRSRKEIEHSEAKFRTVVEEAPMAVCLFTDRERHIVEIANDAMLAIWGKDASVIGKPFDEAVPEISDQPFIGYLNGVYETGEPYRGTAVPADLEVNGVMTTIYFDFIYEPLIDGNGDVYAILAMSMDVTAQEQARRKVEVAERKLRAAIELAGLGTWELDLANRQVLYSERMQEWTGIDQSVVDMDGSGRIHPDDRVRIAAALQRAISPAGNGKFDETYKIINAADNSTRIIHANGQTVFNQDGVPVSISGTAQDVTLQRELQIALEQEVQVRTEELAASNEELAASNEALQVTNEELAETNELLVRSNEELAQYAYVASHDLQEPLRKIRVFTGMLQQAGSEVSGLNQELVGKIAGSAKRMSALINDLLEFSRLLKEDDRFLLVNLNEIASAVMDDFELIGRDKGANFILDRLPEIEAIPLQMNQLFYNLVSNALKFTKPETPPVIRISAERADEPAVRALVRKPIAGMQYYRICVSDNGIGFEQEYADQIFEVFKRLHTRDTYAGSGIGLALCRRIVENHHGTLTATSTPGAGSSFCILLPTRQESMN